MKLLPSRRGALPLLHVPVGVTVSLSVSTRTRPIVLQHRPSAARAGGSHCLSQPKYAHPPHCFTASAVPADAEKQRGGCAYLR